MPQFSRVDEAIAFLVKHSEALNKVFHGALFFLLSLRVVEWQKLFERYPFVA